MGFGQEYRKCGIKNYYLSNFDSYSNPHASDIQTLVKRESEILNPNWKYLDLACGDGVVTKALIESNCHNVEGCDPFVNELYRKNTGKECLPVSFEQISFGILSNKKYNVVICSYALHLIATSFLPHILYNLAAISDKLVILTPHKRPEINMFWKIETEKRLNKTKMKVYKKIVDL